MCSYFKNKSLCMCVFNLQGALLRLNDGNPPCTCVWWVAYVKELLFICICHFAKYRISKDAIV